MTRPARVKLLALALVAGALTALVLVRPGLPVLVGLVLVAAAPGRLVGLLWRDLLRGRRLLDAGQPAQAAAALQRFLAELRARPWKRHLAWSNLQVYTGDVEAMAEHDLGCALLAQERLDDAAARFEAALARDPAYALPYAGLALVHALRGDDARAAEQLARARALGFTGGVSDRVVRGATAVFARLEG